MQSPPQVIVCVHIEPVGQASPPTTHGTVYDGVGIVMQTPLVPSGVQVAPAGH